MDVIIIKSEIERLKGISADMLLASNDAIEISKQPGVVKENYDALMKNQHQMIVTLAKSLGIATNIIENIVLQNNQLERTINVCSYDVKAPIFEN